MMMKLAVLSTLVACCAAFAPSSQKATKTVLAASNFAEEVGVVPPLGLFDPLGLLKDADQESFDKLRESELKHGRVAMLAVVGYLTTASGFRAFGLDEFTADGLKAFPSLLQSEDGKNVLFQMLAFFLVAEVINRDSVGKSEFVGDYRNGGLDFGWDSFDDATKLKKRNIELNNGRAAMMGIAGLVTHEVIGNSILPGGILPGQ